MSPAFPFHVARRSTSGHGKEAAADHCRGSLLPDRPVGAAAGRSLQARTSSCPFQGVDLHVAAGHESGLAPRDF